jgi:hypothetical protein
MSVENDALATFHASSPFRYVKLGRKGPDGVDWRDLLADGNDPEQWHRPIWRSDRHAF